MCTAIAMCCMQACCGIRAPPCIVLVLRLAGPQAARAVQRAHAAALRVGVAEALAFPKRPAAATAQRYLELVLARHMTARENLLAAVRLYGKALNMA